MTFLASIYFILPAYFANMAPPIFHKLGWLKFLNFPLDFNKKIRGKPIFGSHKTFMGVVSGIIAATVTVAIQKYLYDYEIFQNLSLINYPQTSVLLLGLLFGLGTILGDAIESAIKRRLDIKPGGKFIPWDQIDFLIGSLIFVSIIYIPPLKTIIVLLIITPLLHFSANVIGYLLKIKKVWW